MPTCNRCGIELTDDNWSPSFQKKRNYWCKLCEVKRVRAWQKQHSYDWKKLNRERSRDYMREYLRKYRKKNPEKVRAFVRVEQHRRRRELPTDTILNKHFEGADLHHITPSIAVYIPTTLHESVWHRLRTGEGMDEINTKAIEWLQKSFYTLK